MRKLMALVAIALGALSVTAVAIAQSGNTEQGLAVKASPTKAGTKKAPKNASLDVTTTTTNKDGSQPPVVSKAVIYFPKGFEFNGKYFKSCTAAILDAKGPSGCPKGSKVGTGNAEAMAGTDKFPPAVIDAFNGPGGKKIELYLTIPSIGLAQTIEGSISKATGAFAYKLTVPIPENIQQPIPNMFVSLTRFNTKVKATTVAKVGKKKRKVGYVETVSCPKTRKWNFKGVFTTRDGQTMTATSSQACKS
jgi:hypothetical protein